MCLSLILTALRSVRFLNSKILRFVPLHALDPKFHLGVEGVFVLPLCIESLF